MEKKIWSVEKRLTLTKFIIDKKPHIEVNYEICRKCESRICVKACPAGLYTIDENGELRFNYEGCLECGTCKMVCPLNAIKWNFPRGGFGVYYQFG